MGYLPVEIVLQIVASIPRDHDQPTLWACSLVSRAWYAASVEELYSSPVIETRNFQRFVRTVCPSINSHVRRSACADLVRVLDMSRLVHDSNKSLTARLLGRLKERLEIFVAPAASFAINSLAALSKCSRLRVLDLSLVWSSMELMSLMRTVSQLKRLQIFHFPNAYTADTARHAYPWPPALRTLHITRTFPVLALCPHELTPRAVEEEGEGSEIPVWPPRPPYPSLTRLSITQCNATYPLFRILLHNLGHSLLNLEIIYPMQKLEMLGIGLLLGWCPQLRRLRIPAEIISWLIFVDPDQYDAAPTGAADAADPDAATASAEPAAALLEELVLDRTVDAPTPTSGELLLLPRRASLYISASRYGLRNLRRVRISHKCSAIDTGGPLDEAALLDVLQRNEDDAAKAGGHAYVAREVGVWIF